MAYLAIGPGRQRKSGGALENETSSSCLFINIELVCKQRLFKHQPAVDSRDIAVPMHERQETADMLK